MSNLVPALVISYGVGIVATRASIEIAKTLHIVDRPGEIKIHQSNVPRFGGLGIIVGTFLTLIGSIWYGSLQDGIAAFLVMCLPIVITGALDDIRGLTPVAKLLGQATSGLAASIVLIRGALPGLALLPSIFWVMVFTTFLCFLSNSMNLLDGMDGLAAGATSIIGFSLATLAVLAGESQLAVFPLAVSGACLGFLVFNLPPAKTFMGDIGSIFLGYAVGVAALQLILKGSPSVSRVLGISLILLVPIADTSFAIARRMMLHKNLLRGDRLHLYDCLHRSLGGDTWKTLVLMWCMSLVSALGGVVASLCSERQAAILVLIGIAGMVFFARKIGTFGMQPPARRSRLPL